MQHGMVGLSHVPPSREQGACTPARSQSKPAPPHARDGGGMHPSSPAASQLASNVRTQTQPPHGRWADHPTLAAMYLGCPVRAGGYWLRASTRHSSVAFTPRFPRRIDALWLTGRAARAIVARSLPWWPVRERRHLCRLRTVELEALAQSRHFLGHRAGEIDRLRRVVRHIVELKVAGELASGGVVALGEQLELTYSHSRFWRRALSGKPQQPRVAYRVEVEKDLGAATLGTVAREAAPHARPVERQMGTGAGREAGGGEKSWQPVCHVYDGVNGAAHRCGPRE
mmetsp:Transcript_18009/g.40325  ORF Transcript_18009/g.40325 Transcript_18009/m.40325 type:complete len:284 (-) Transcript_18009:1031-1882(-)